MAKSYYKSTPGGYTHRRQIEDAIAIEHDIRALLTDLIREFDRRADHGGEVKLTIKDMTTLTRIGIRLDELRDKHRTMNKIITQADNIIDMEAASNE